MALFDYSHRYKKRGIRWSRNPRVLFIIGRDIPHSFHAALAKSLHADFYSTAKKGQPTLKELLKDILTLPKNYDISISETIFYIPTTAKIFGLIPKDALVINITADPILYNMVNGYKNKIPKFINRFLLKKVDGFIIVGKWGHLLDQVGLRTPRKEIFGGVNDDLAEKLKKLPINKKKFENNHQIIFVGNINKYRVFYKGMDLIIEAIKRVKREFSDVKLIITGDSNLDESYPFIKFSGNVDLTSIFPKVSLAVFMGRGDTFPLGSVETMMAGIPTIVSTDTGTKEIVEKIDKGFICNLNSEELANKIINYFKLDVKSKIKLAKAFRKEASKYTEKRAVKNFKRKFLELITEIKNKSV